MSAAFVTPLVLIPRRARRSTCTRAQAKGAGGMDDWTGSEDWGEERNVQKGVQRLEFVIRQDGTVTELVTGVRGTDCVKLTKKIEERLGFVTHTSKTGEFFEEALVEEDAWESEKNINREGGLSSW